LKLKYVLEEKYKYIDFSLLGEGAWWYEGTDKEPRALVDDRINALIRKLRDRPETRIAIIGHSILFRRLTGEKSLKNCQIIIKELDKLKFRAPNRKCRTCV